MNNNIPEKKWVNYFSNMRNKYNTRVSKNKVLIIFLDAKDSSKNHINLFKGSNDDFFISVQKTAKFFTQRYNCLSILGTDEISFIFENSDELINTINNEKKYRTHDIVSIFSQYFFEHFNDIYTKQTIYWHCNCFNIPKEKINSYLIYKSRGILKGTTAYFLKQKGIKNPNGIKLDKKLELFYSYEDHTLIEDYKEGLLYLNGSQISFDEYINGNIQKIDTPKNTNEPNIFLDLKEFDELL